MPDRLLIALDAVCMACGGEVLRNEVEPGSTVRIPDHTCAEVTSDGS